MLRLMHVTNLQHQPYSFGVVGILECLAEGIHHALWILALHRTVGVKGEQKGD